MQNRYRVIVIVGPTASGKSALAVEVAKKFNGEVVSADSRQVYRGMDLGTGKVTHEEMQGIPHYLIDVADPKEEYNASNFQKDAARIIEEIVSRGKLPIIVGGSGFWIDSLIFGFELPEVEPNAKLRKGLEARETKDLFEELEKKDPQRAKHIDQNNRRRLIRALEVVLSTNKPVPELRKESRYDALWIGIKLPQEELEKRIHDRLLDRLKSGMVGEIQRLNDEGVSWGRLDSFGLEYRFISQHLQGKLEYEEMVQLLNMAIRQYAKRQMTWFKRNKEIKWIEKTGEADLLLRRFLL